MKQEFWNTLLRVVRVNDYNNTITISIPAWDSRQTIDLAITRFPEELRPLLARDYRVHVEVNIGVTDKVELKFQNWNYIPNETIDMQLKARLKDFKR